MKKYTCPYCLKEDILNDTDRVCSNCGHETKSFFSLDFKKLYWKGKELQQEGKNEEAFAYFLRSARIGNAKSMFELGMYYKSKSGEKARSLYMYCILSSAQLNNFDALEEILGNPIFLDIERLKIKSNVKKRINLKRVKNLLKNYPRLKYDPAKEYHEYSYSGLGNEEVQRAASFGYHDDDLEIDGRMDYGYIDDLGEEEKLEYFEDEN